jgi:hypothetical protein
VCTLLLSHIFFLFLPAHLFFISLLLLFIFMLLVALFFLLTLPLVEENTRSYSGFRGFTHFNLTFQKRSSPLWICSNVTCRAGSTEPSCFAFAKVKTFTFPFP